MKLLELRCAGFRDFEWDTNRKAKYHLMELKLHSGEEFAGGLLIDREESKNISIGSNIKIVWDVEK